jgi:cytochrome c-type biogenesis protein CcmH/NrfG
MSGPRRARTAVPAALLALGVLGTAPWGIMLLRGGHRRAPRPPAIPANPDYAAAMTHCRQLLAVLRKQAARRPGDGAAQLRLAALELNHAGLLALVAYEGQLGAAPGSWLLAPGESRPCPNQEPGARSQERERSDQCELPVAPQRSSSDESYDDYPGWRARFLRSDPERSLTRTSDAARAALRSPLDADAHRQALLLLAAARRGLADYRGEAAALSELARRSPDQPEYWMRLAEAYARGRRFARAEAAMGRGLKLLYAQSHPRREESRVADRPSPTRRG